MQFAGSYFQKVLMEWAEGVGQQVQGQGHKDRDH
jgi:hypothetical protein